MTHLFAFEQLMTELTLASIKILKKEIKESFDKI
jgi:hypothetical protein